MLKFVISFAWTAAALAAPPEISDLFSTPPKTTSPSQHKRTAIVDLSLLDRMPTDGSGKLRFNLFDDVSFTALFSHLDTVSTDSHAWWGTLEGEPLGTFTLVHNRDGMAAVIRSPSKGSFSLHATPGGNALIEQINPTPIQCLHTGSGDSLSKSSTQSMEKAVIVQAVPVEESNPPVIYGCDDGTVIDIMIAYTTAARIAAGGTANMNSNIALAISDANAAFNRSLINTSLHLVFTYESSYTETGNFQTDTNAYLNFSDGQMDDIPPLRDLYGADCVSLWMNTYNLFGYGWFPDGSLQGIGASGLTLMDWRGYNGLLLAHEMGHNLWCDHDHAHAVSLGNEYSNYSFGYTQQPDNAWQDIMSQSPGVPEIPYYANPNVNWPGPNPPHPGPTGVVIGQPNASDLATTITQTRNIVANFRVTSVPGLSSVLYVNAGATGANNGTSWTNACINLQDALCKAAGSHGVVQQIWVAAGTYKPDRGGGDRTASFNLQNNIAIYGGFAGGETLLIQRNWNTNISILSGDIGVAGNNADNSYHVVKSAGNDATARLDGFRITGGNANSANYPDYDGGGMRLEGTSPTIVNCTFTVNNASDVGGGVENINAANAKFTSCTFSSNTANGAGAMSSDLSTPVVRDCTFIGNNASWGGAVWNNNSSPVFFANCRFFGNHATGSAGGAMENDNSSPTLVNCLLSGNTAVWYGGAFANYQGSAGTKLINCTFSRNSAGIYGGGIVLDATNLTLTNTILWGNTVSGTTQDEQIHLFSGTPTINSCILQGWTGSLGGTANNGTNPLFVDSDGADNIVGNADDNCRISSGSPAIDTGDPAALPADTADLNDNANTAEATPLDLDRHPRILGTALDRGAYELVPNIPADFDHDGDVDNDDFLHFKNCATRANVPQNNPACADAKLDADTDVDMSDFAIYQRCYSGPMKAAKTTCAN